MAHGLMWLWIGGWAVICGVWSVLLLMQIRLRRGGMVLEPAKRGGDADEAALPMVCVVIPACNEQRVLAHCLESVLEQDYPRLRVVVVDDRSTDSTASIAEAFAAEDDRVRIERVTHLPEQWLGKSHALWRGTRQAEGDWLLFVDADCVLDRAAVRTVVAEATRRGVELLTLWPRHAARTFWEHMLIPLCGGVIALWFARGAGGADDGPPFANGQFLLIDRLAYERIGGHQAVRRALIEDVPFAEHARRQGVRGVVACGRSLASVRMYDCYTAIRDGWARIFVGALRSGWKIALSIAWLAAGSLMPFVAAPVLGAMWFEAWSSGQARSAELTALAGLCANHLLLIGVVSWRFWGLGHCSRRHLLLYPVSVVVVMGILLRAWWWLAVRRSVRWRATRYALDRSGAIVS